MTRHRRMISLVLAFSMLAFYAPGVWAQKDKKKNDDQQDVMERERNIRREKTNVFKDWLAEDVAYIITDEEKRAFKKLATNEEREKFIEDFWRKRDPDPDTEVNEYLEEHYERVAYANQHFASGIPGWKTDRGRIYIVYGPPHERETHPTGGSYQRPSYHGGGSTTTYPFEVWFYRYLPGVGSGIEIEFVDPTGTGEYRIARSPEEKDALLNIPGAGLTLNESLGLSSKADRIAGLGSYGYSGPGAREQDSPFTRMQLITDLSRPPKVNELLENSLVTVSRGIVEDESLNVSTKVDFFRASDERVMTALTVQTENEDLTFKDVGGVQVARLNIYGRVTSVNGRRVTSFEDPVTTTATVEELTGMKDRKSAYQRVLPLSPGTYKVDLLVRDINSGAQILKQVGFTVPKFEPEKLASSSLVLAVKLEALNDQLPGMFSIGPYKVLPNVSGVFKRGQEVGIYMQIYNAGIDQTTLRPSIDVEYVLTDKSGKEILKQNEDWRGLSDSGQRLTLARLLPTTQLATGEYTVMIRVRDKVSGQTLSPSSKFTVVENKTE